MLAVKAYDRARAVTYAETWALGRNPLFSNYAGRGGDCTGFASQVLLAGCCTMNFTKDFGWYYISDGDRAPAWTSVEYFYDFLTGQPAFARENGGIGPFGHLVPLKEAEEGDFIQLADTTGDFYHTLVITGFTQNDVLVCAHTDDAYNRRLSTYNYASLRCIHIDGIAIDVGEDTCFEALLDGKSLPFGRPAETEPEAFPEKQARDLAPLDLPPEEA